MLLNASCRDSLKNQSLLGHSGKTTLHSRLPNTCRISNKMAPVALCCFLPGRADFFSHRFLRCEIIRACWLSRRDLHLNLIASGSPDMCPLSDGRLPIWQRVFYWTDEMNRLPLKKTCSVYFAGRVNETHGPDLWRQAFGVRQNDDGSVEPHIFGDEFGHQSMYCGPRIAGAHSCVRHEGFAYSEPHNAEMDVRDQCVSDIRDADLVVARLDTGAYGSMWECGYAAALDKRTIELVCHDDLWFASPGLTPPSGHFDKWQKDWRHLVNARLAANFRLASWAEDSCESPLELLVCEELHKTCWHMHEMILSLQPQYRIAGYRLDLACPEKKVAFEFDGFTYHSKRDQFNRDRERDRALSELGWKTVRFHGDEIRQSPARIIDAIRKECCDSYRADSGLPPIITNFPETIECIA